MDMVCTYFLLARDVRRVTHTCFKIVCLTKSCLLLTWQMLVFFTWVVRGVADTVSMWDAVERVTSFATQVTAGTQAAILLELAKTAWPCASCCMTLFMYYITSINTYQVQGMLQQLTC